MDSSWGIPYDWATVMRLLGIPYTRRSTGVVVILCPFHKERHASLHCWPRSGRYHCHGCHSDGTIEEFANKFGLGIDRLYRAPFNDPNQLKLDL